MDDLSDRLALNLLDKCVGPDQLIGVCMERSVDLVISLLGILKAGAAYVALDPSFPLERLAFIVEDADIK